MRDYAKIVKRRVGKNYGQLVVDAGFEFEEQVGAFSAPAVPAVHLRDALLGVESHLVYDVRTFHLPSPSFPMFYIICSARLPLGFL